MSSHMVSTVTQVWRVRVAGRVAGVCLVASWVALTALLSVDGGVALTAILSTAALCLALGVWRWAFVPSVTLGDSALFIVNRVGGQTVPYSQITNVSNGYYGIIVRMRDGNSVRAWAVQKGNLNRWLGKRTRSDDLVDAIMLKVRQG
jgi:hypothetical protein